MELANKLLQNQLARICSSDLGRKNWEKSLPKAIQSINSYFPYKCGLSRVQLLFSPFIFCQRGGVFSLKNPVQHQKMTFHKLNAHRINNLLNKKGKGEKCNFQIGQYVTLIENLPDRENPKKLNIPANSQLFKIIAIHKNGFTLSLSNISTGEVFEVLGDNVQQLKLESLEEITYSTPELYNRLVGIRNRLRNKYIPGTKTRDQLFQIPLTNSLYDTGQRDDHSSGSDEPQGIEEGDPVEKKDDLAPDGAFRRAPTFLDPAEDTEDTIEIEPEIQKINTRFKGKKHVPIYRIGISENKNLQNLRSILSKTNYTFNSNFDVTNFRGVDKSSFKARKLALESHQFECKLGLCEICNMYKQIKSYKWDGSCLGRYNLRHAIHEKKSTLKRKNVTFDKSVLIKQPMNSNFTINLSQVYQACNFNISFKELALLTDNKP